MYGNELIIDLYDCDVSRFNRKDLNSYLLRLCNLIDMIREDLHWWDYDDDPEGYKHAPKHLKGTSCVQFIKTSTIVIHTLEVPKLAMINIFSCKDFSTEEAVEFTKNYFDADTVKFSAITRGDLYQ